MNIMVWCNYKQTNPLQKFNLEKQKQKKILSKNREFYCLTYVSWYYFHTKITSNHAQVH